MSSLDADSIIAEEQLNDTNSAVEETPNAPDTGNESGDNNDTPAAPTDGDAPQEPSPEEPKEEQPTEPEKQEENQPEVEPTATKTVEEAKSFIQNLNLTEDKIFNTDGTVREWREVVPAGKYLASQLEPVVVTDKDGKTHEFMLLSDVEKQFPDGFEAKNNIEQMKFQQAILDNESRFKQAIKEYNDAEQQYNRETGGLVQQREANNRLATEYRAMADQGLVPKVGDPRDPKFGESDAVKEMNKILDWMDTKNAENKKAGLGEITSLYVAKQLMDIEVNKTDKEDKKQQVIQERNHVASMSSSPSPTPDKKPPVADIPLSRLADEIIASEGLR